MILPGDLDNNLLCFESGQWYHKLFWFHIYTVYDIQYTVDSINYKVDYWLDKITKVVHSYKDKIPLSSVSDGIWSDPGISKEFYVANVDEAVEQAAVVNTRADRLRSSVIHEQKHFLGEILLPNTLG